MILIGADELLTYWDELWEDHCVTQSELHHIIKDEWSDIHRYTLEELSEKNWHYPSKGEYPPKGKQILAYAWNVHYVLAKYDTFDGEDKFVTFDAYNGFIEIKKVICWQYIIPPKEEE